MAKTPETPEAAPVTGVALMRQPFPERLISKKPVPTKSQTDELKNDRRVGIKCQQCGGWHHRDAVHLDYVGHAALTDRLLDADPAWSWEPVANPLALGLPMAPGGMWIRLTIDGVTRLGYGDPDGKNGGNAVKEVIGDALRNAAMRFGAALDLWFKGDLHADEPTADQPTSQAGEVPAAVAACRVAIDLCKTPAALDAWSRTNKAALDDLPEQQLTEVRRYWKAARDRLAAAEQSKRQPEQATSRNDFDPAQLEGAL